MRLQTIPRSGAACPSLEAGDMVASVWPTCLPMFRPQFIFQQQVDPIGADNNSWLMYLAAHSGIVIACWGNWKVMGRDEAVKELVADLYCLGTTKLGRPKHPLYLSRETKPIHL